MRLNSKMKVQIVKPLYVGGVYVCEKGDVLIVKEYQDRIFFVKNGISVLIPKDYYKIMK